MQDQNRTMLTVPLAVVVVVMVVVGCLGSGGGPHTQEGTFTLAHGKSHFFELSDMSKISWELNYLEGNATLDIIFMAASQFAAMLKGENYTWVMNLSTLNVTSANISQTNQSQLDRGLYYLVVLNPSRELPDASGTVTFHLWVEYYD